MEGEGRVRKHMLGQRNTLNESTIKSFEGLLVITYFFFLFCFSCAFLGHLLSLLCCPLGLFGFWGAQRD